MSWNFTKTPANKSRYKTFQRQPLNACICFWAIKIKKKTSAAIVSIDYTTSVSVYLLAECVEFRLNAIFTLNFSCQLDVFYYDRKLFDFISLRLTLGGIVSIIK